MLALLAEAADADTVIIDSTKDAAVKLSDDETGAGWNRARQVAIAAGAQVAELAHPRKPQADNKKPTKLEDVYGSRWITSGAGSVVMLHGEASALTAELLHLKAPADPVGPWTVTIDAGTGGMIREGAADLLEHVARKGAEGLTARGAAQYLDNTYAPTAAQVARARRKLDAKVTAGHLVRREGAKGGPAGGDPARWFLAARGPR
jgi:hypothetical protein